MKLINLLKNIGISIWTILIVISITGVISFISISCVLVWGLSLSLIIHINPDYDIVYLGNIVSIMIRIFIFEVCFLTISFILNQVFKIKKHEIKI